MRHQVLWGLQRDNTDILCIFGKGLLREGLGTHNLVLFQVEGWRMQFRGAATCGETWKAYDRVPRQEVWRCKREKGLPDNYVMIVQDMYEGARTRAKTNVHGQ